MSKDNPKISIVMPSYNVGQFMDKCLGSVVNQTLDDIEILCVDAGSSDETLDIIERHAKDDSRIKLIHSDVKSYGYQMNLGISNAAGEYIGIVETDDYVEEKMFEALYDITQNRTADISKINFFHLYSDDPDDFRYRIDSSKKGLPDDKFSLKNNLNFIKGHPCIWAAIYKKSFLEKNDISFMEEPGAGWVDNPFLFETAICAESITYKDEPFYYYRELNPESSTNDLKDLTLPMRRMLDVFDIIDKYSCNYDEFLSVFYIRVFGHVRDIVKNHDVEGDAEVLSYVREVLKKLKEDIVLRDFGVEEQEIYYKYLASIDSLDENTFNFDDLKYIKNENDFLYSRISKLESDNKGLASKNKDLSNKNKDLANEINSIKNSKAFKIGSLIAMPIRKLRKLFK